MEENELRKMGKSHSKMENMDGKYFDFFDDLYRIDFFIVITKIAKNLYRQEFLH